MLRIAILCLGVLLYGKPIISVSIPPQAYFLKQIAQDTIEINTIIPKNTDPHTFEFKPKALAKLQKSDLYLTIGLEFERIWLPKIKDSFPKLKVQDITNNIHYIHNPHSHDIFHDDTHESDNDPHIWLSPENAVILAENIASILIQTYPHQKDFYEKNLNAFLERVANLNKTIQTKLQSIPSRYLLVYHPSWSYFAQSFLLRQVAIEKDGKEPTAKQLEQTMKLVKQYNIKTIFIQNRFLTPSIKMIAEAFGTNILIVDPLAYEWEQELLKITGALASQ